MQIKYRRCGARTRASASLFWDGHVPVQVLNFIPLLEQSKDEMIRLIVEKK